jgi:hypothetical protein
VIVFLQGTSPLFNTSNRIRIPILGGLPRFVRRAMYVHVGLGNLVTDVDDEGGDRKAGNLRRGVEVRESGTNHTEERGHDEGGNVYDEPKTQSQQGSRV